MLGREEDAPELSGTVNKGQSKYLRYDHRAWVQVVEAKGIPVVHNNISVSVCPAMGKGKDGITSVDNLTRHSKVMKCPSPSWNGNFEFINMDESIDNLRISLNSHKAKSIVPFGECIINLMDIRSQQESQEQQNMPFKHTLDQWFNVYEPLLVQKEQMPVLFLHLEYNTNSKCLLNPTDSLIICEISGHKLRSRLTGGSANIYFVFNVIPQTIASPPMDGDMRRCEGTKITDIQFGTSEPHINLSGNPMQFSISKDDCSGKRLQKYLHVSVWNYDKHSFDDLMGEVIVPLTKLQSGQRLQEWFEVKPPTFKSQEAVAKIRKSYENISGNAIKTQHGTGVSPIVAHGEEASGNEALSNQDIFTKHNLKSHIFFNVPKCDICDQSFKYVGDSQGSLLSNGSEGSLVRGDLDTLPVSEEPEEPLASGELVSRIKKHAGLKCKQCGMNCHTECADYAPNYCPTKPFVKAVAFQKKGRRESSANPNNSDKSAGTGSTSTSSSSSPSSGASKTKCCLPLSPEHRYVYDVKDSLCESSSSCSEYPSRSNMYFTGRIRCVVSYVKEILLPLGSYMPMYDLIFKSDLYILKTLQKCQKNARANDELANTLVKVFANTSPQDVMVFIESSLKVELDSTADKNTLFRSNSLVTKSIDVYLKYIGNSYLKSTLEGFLQKLYKDAVNCEIDVSRIRSSASSKKKLSEKEVDDILARHTKSLQYYAQILVVDIFYSISKCPWEFHKVFYIVGKAVEMFYVKKSLEEGFHLEDIKSIKYTAISAFLFLRFFCPAILNPGLFGLQYIPPDDRRPSRKSSSSLGISGKKGNKSSDREQIFSRSLTLIAKTVQNLANLVNFGEKESYMMCMNDFIEQNKESMENFLDNICGTDRRISLANICEEGGSLPSLIDSSDTANGFTHSPESFSGGSGNLSTGSGSSSRLFVKQNSESSYKESDEDDDKARANVPACQSDTEPFKTKPTELEIELGTLFRFFVQYRMEMRDIHRENTSCSQGANGNCSSSTSAMSRESETSTFEEFFYIIGHIERCEALVKSNSDANSWLGSAKENQSQRKVPQADGFPKDTNVHGRDDDSKKDKKQKKVKRLKKHLAKWSSSPTILTSDLLKELTAEVLRSSHDLCSKLGGGERSRHSSHAEEQMEWGTRRKKEIASAFYSLKGVIEKQLALVYVLAKHVGINMKHFKEEFISDGIERSHVHDGEMHEKRKGVITIISYSKDLQQKMNDLLRWFNSKCMSNKITENEAEVLLNKRLVTNGYPQQNEMNDCPDLVGTSPIEVRIQQAKDIAKVSTYLYATVYKTFNETNDR
eukprot:Nk52_evm11s2133 gene=Nk52_evmTU11s2133